MVGGWVGYCGFVGVVFCFDIRKCSWVEDVVDIGVDCGFGYFGNVVCVLVEIFGKDEEMCVDYEGFGFL